MDNAVPFASLLLAAVALVLLYGAVVAAYSILTALLAWRNQQHLAQVCLLRARVNGLQQRHRFAQRLQREANLLDYATTSKEVPHV